MRTFGREFAGCNPGYLTEMRVRFLVGEDPLEEELAIHFNILAWRIPRTEAPGRLQSMRLHRIRHN